MTDAPLKLAQEIALMVEVQSALSSTTAAKVTAIDKVLRSASPEVVADMPGAQALIAGAYEAAEIAIGGITRSDGEVSEDDLVAFECAIIDALRDLSTADARAAMQAMVDAAVKKREEYAISVLMVDHPEAADWLSVFLGGPYIAAAIREGRE
jgi:hypothetical protein